MGQSKPLSPTWFGNNLNNTMKKIYWFQRKNINGLPFGDIMDVDERTAWDYLQIPRNFLYIGCSDGRFILEAQKKVTIKRERGINVDIPEAKKKLIREAVVKEIELAKQNRVAPPDHRRMNLAGGPMDVDIQRYIKI